MVPQRRLDGFYGFLLDGQQRLTSLSLAIQGEAEAELAQRGFFDLENELFYLGAMKRTITKRVEADAPLIVPLSDIVVPSPDGEADLQAVEHVIQALREQGKLGKGHLKEIEYRKRLHRLATMLKRAALCEEFTSKEARSWPSGRSLKDVLLDCLNSDPLAVHHIFLQDRDFPLDRLNIVANYAILSQADNAELADRDPFDVWRTLKSNQREWASTQLCFTANENLLQAYDEFIEFRAEKLAEQLNEFVGLGERRSRG